jgi:hypothetical protein
MWVFTQHGFVSIVSSLEDPKVVMVRARDRKSLEQFIEALEGSDPFTGETLEIVASRYTDYPFRVICSRSAVSQYLADEALSIDYSNFKSRATQTRGNAWHDVLMSIWSRALGLSDKPKPTYSFPKVPTEDELGPAPFCDGRTKKGSLCMHEARIGYKTCWQHASQEADLRHQDKIDGRLTNR